MISVVCISQVSFIVFEDDFLSSLQWYICYDLRCNSVYFPTAFRTLWPCVPHLNLNFWNCMTWSLDRDAFFMETQIPFCILPFCQSMFSHTELLLLVFRLYLKKEGLFYIPCLSFSMNFIHTDNTTRLPDVLLASLLCW